MLTELRTVICCKFEMIEVKEFVTYLKILFQNPSGVTKEKQFEFCQHNWCPVQD
jgi:hypothetical protein